MQEMKKSGQKPKGEVVAAKAVSVGARIRYLRETQGLSQGDIEKATGLLRCYTSRVENGHTVPSLETLERFAAALGVPLYTLFLTAEESPFPAGAEAGLIQDPSGKGPRGGRTLTTVSAKMRALLGRISDSDRELLLSFGKKLAAR